VAVGAVVALVGTLAGVALASGPTSAAPRTPVAPGTAHALQSVPAAKLRAASSKVSALHPATLLKAAPLLANHKPELLYIGAEFCPACAAERWALVVALSQFGTFKNLQQTRSAVQDGNIATVSFYGSTYDSRYLTFTPVETTTNQPQGNHYRPLETPTAAQQALWSSTQGGRLSFPFLDIGGKYLLDASQYPVSVLEGQSFDQIASKVGNNNTATGATIDAAAAALVNYISDVTGHQPALPDYVGSS
jgi:hypothetical protein